ncbi:MAG: NADH-quinone oxidoreductase subunit NuoH [Acidimicrobiales bacterium]|jgi:NADH-quinone oxidoreductase subunit H|nr:NADH-quinone oxidoreductase subunit NuoH [Acidimicrobiales bacterium]|tara:strand:+ start:628 stop:1653 length:1026 start_codon:yes stop_codon:yes gene_type:complete
MSLLALPYWQETAIKLGLALAVIPATSLILVYLFLFKMMAFMQSRLGPNDTGPYGSLQLIADAVKFLQKEDINPAQADRRVFRMAPVVVLASTFLLYVVIPVGPDAVVQNLDTGVFYALAVSSLSVLGILMAGWASANKYALLGGLRAAGQLIAYELPLILAVMGVVIQAETLNLQGIVEAQATGEIFGFGAIGNPFILTQFFAFLIFMIAAQAELTQTPFDMPVAETELVGGFHVEYTGFRFLLFFMAEFGTAFAFSALAAVMFLGGWWIPGFDVDDNLLNVLGPGVMLVKILLIASFIFWVRFTYPRLREDQLQKFAWKILIPLALANIVLTGIFKVVF